MELAIVLLLATAAVGTALYPVVRRAPPATDARTPLAVTQARATGRNSGTTPAVSDEALDAALDAEVGHYREAIRAGTLCRRCSQANPRGSRFCAECGGRLAGAS